MHWNEGLPYLAISYRNKAQATPCSKFEYRLRLYSKENKKNTRKKLLIKCVQNIWDIGRAVT